MRRLLTRLAAGMAILLLTSCASTPSRPPPTIDQIVQMANSGRSAEDIVRELQDSRAVYALTASQIIRLHEQGVPQSVLDYMQNAYAEAIRRDARWEYESALWWHSCFYCYGPPVIVAPR